MQNIHEWLNTNIEFQDLRSEKKSNERIFFEAQSNSQTRVFFLFLRIHFSRSRNVRKIPSVHITRNASEANTHKKSIFRQRSIRGNKKVEHSKTDVKEAKHFFLISLSAARTVW